ncbi:UNVERIFIED_CONTAM: hypothetical protein HDU68_004101, partial [Siphonaria sp. JEL0065]
FNKVNNEAKVLTVGRACEIWYPLIERPKTCEEYHTVVKLGGIFQVIPQRPDVTRGYDEQDIQVLKAASSKDSEGSILFAGRAAIQDGGVQVGKVLAEKGCHIGYGGQELIIDTKFEILCGASDSITEWAQVTDGVTSESFMDLNPIPAGHEHNKTPLFIAVCVDKETSSMQIGKCSNGWQNCSFGYGGEEKWSSGSFLVLIQTQ